MARPKLKLDEALIEKLAMIHCTPKEIASIVGCSEDTIIGRFSELLAKGREKGKMSLRRAMFDKALGGNCTMMIWLSKQHLGMNDRTENVNLNLTEKIESKTTIDVKKIIDSGDLKMITQKLAELEQERRRIEGEVEPINVESIPVPVTLPDKIEDK